MEIKQVLTTYYKNRFEKELIEEIIKVGVYKKLQKEDVLIEIGQAIRSMPLVLNGAMKILREDEKGNELLLYFLERGDTCALTLTCCVGQKLSELRAVAEMETELIMLPKEKMEEWLVFKSWRDFVFESYHMRFHEMLDAIDSLAFMNMKERLIKYLSNKVLITKDNWLTLSHQEIAYELNTSRVVISRLLKQLENEDLLSLHRNKIEMLQY